jgi:superfamily I DNA/RNA helicase
VNYPKIALDSNLGSQTDNAKIQQASDWFRNHVTLFGAPYTLDDDQVRATIDTHKNTLVTARAGSGKTRVIVAKVAYLVAHGLASLDEIAIFMFNRTAAAEVNERIAEVKVNGVRLASVCQERLKEQSANRGSLEANVGKPHTITIASTFHKFALDLVKLSGEHPEIISSEDQDSLIRALVQSTLSELHLKLTPKEQQEMLGIVNNFITRAGQYYPGYAGLKNLQQKVYVYCQNSQNSTRNVRFHQVALEVYQKYLSALRSPQIDFNLLMHVATELLHNPQCTGRVSQRIAPLKYILIDEYQDFSYLFFALVQAMRGLAPSAHLFCVGDDWQAINRFAGSDVNYFINFANYFPENAINIPLATNYRSDRRIVEYANHYMLVNYNPQAIPARAFSRRNGKIYRLNPNKTRFDFSDLQEDCLGDGQILLALGRATSGKIPPNKIPPGAARLLKAVVQIIRRHSRERIMLLHRHNFTSFDSITLEIFLRALRHLVVRQGIMTEVDFSQQVRCMTMHRSKGLESDIVILLEFNRDIIQSAHPHATIFQLFGDTHTAEIADQQRLIYVALTRAKHRLYLLSTDQPPAV